VCVCLCLCGECVWGGCGGVSVLCVVSVFV